MEGREGGMDELIAAGESGGRSDGWEKGKADVKEGRDRRMEGHVDLRRKRL
jgi:hypothetical protein